ncbi:MAG: trigger factor [Bacilli bacterium]|nr:trigger factor [Bacilli bacterium]
MANKKNTHEVVIKIEGKEWTDALDVAFKEKVKTAEVAGFRKGKVPRDIYEKKFGKESLYLRASDEVVNTAYQKALDESKLVPVVQPSVDIKDVDDKKIEFTFKIITKPEVTVKKYKGLKVKPEKVEVKKEEIEHELGHILERYTETKSKEGKVEKGNIAVIDFEGFKDGKAFDGGKSENYELEIGSNTFIPGFEEQIIGMKLNEEKDINVTFPKDYHAEDLKGKDVIFKVKVNDIKEKLERKFDKELFEDLGIEGVDSKEKLEKHIEEEIKEAKEMEAENVYVEKLLEAVSKNVEVDIPEEMVEEEIDRMLNRYEEQLKMQGINLEMYYAFTKTQEKDLRAQMEKEAYSHVLYRLMLEEILGLEKVEVKDDEVEKEVDEMAKKYQMKKNDFLNAFGGKDMVKYDLEIRKVIELLKEYNK